MHGVLLTIVKSLLRAVDVPKSGICIDLVYRQLHILLEEGDCDQYWSAIEPVLVTNRKQYWSPREVVLVGRVTSTGRKTP